MTLKKLAKKLQTLEIYFKLLSWLIIGSFSVFIAFMQLKINQENYKIRRIELSPDFKPELTSISPLYPSAENFIIAKIILYNYGNKVNDLKINIESYNVITNDKKSSIRKLSDSDFSCEKLNNTATEKFAIIISKNSINNEIYNTIKNKGSNINITFIIVEYTDFFKKSQKIVYEYIPGFELYTLDENKFNNIINNKNVNILDIYNTALEKQKIIEKSIKMNNEAFKNVWEVLRNKQ